MSDGNSARVGREYRKKNLLHVRWMILFFIHQLICTTLPKVRARRLDCLEGLRLRGG
jgi:hypothetical protein